jgi:phenylpropionate dioxygenase-like ring-hydroxylating dioxygenase large terminal subunit
MEEKMNLVDNKAMLVSRRAYWDPDVYALELARIYRKCWLFVAHESEIPTRGDYVTRRMGEDAVIVTRDESGEPRVFLNTCLHRGSSLCSADIGNTSHFRCSYHGWTYSNRGELRGVPRMRQMYGPEFDKSCFRLVSPPGVDTYQGLIFASWDEQAPPLREYLGDIAWYLDAMLGKAGPLRVVGPPTRTIVQTNWKIGAENYCGDGYHLDTTHKTPIELGVFGAEHELAALGELDASGALCHCASTANGHTVRVQQLPVKLSEPMFLGYPPTLWPRFVENLDERQVGMMSGLAVMHGNVFPNLSFLDGVVVSSGDETPPTAYVHLRQWQPLGPDRTELLLWCLVPKDGYDEQMILNTQRAFVRTLGIGGIFEVDDFQNWVSMAQMNSGGVAQQQTYDYRGGSHLPPDGQTGWPGDVYAADPTEANQRAVYARWHQLMEAESTTNGDGSHE